MKKLILFLLTISFIFLNPLSAQTVLKKVGRAVSNEVLGTSGSDNSVSSKNSDPEPSCACDNGELIVDFGGTLKLNYKETNISIMDDGSLLLKDKISGNYYIVKGTSATGPIPAGDPRLAGFDEVDENSGKDQWLLRYKDYISKSGDKYLITFGGKSYGPYAEIDKFVITKSKDKFGAIAVENLAVTEMDGKAMDEAIKNAKTDQEKMALAMKYSQQMQQKIMKGGGLAGMTQKFITNVAGSTYDPALQFGFTLNADVKYDEILLLSYNTVIDLQGKIIINLKPEHSSKTNIFVNTANTKYAVYNYGEITFSDGTSLKDLFNPHLIKVNGQTYLAYMYYSPKRNALMQCKISF
jgi:hypothetical protein